jgi:hypothetical protein
MKQQLKGIIFILILTIFDVGCKKSDEEDGMDFKVNGIKDVTIVKNQSTSRTITVLYLGGKKEKVNFTYSGVPAGISITTSPSSAIPDFFAEQTIIAANPDTGLYPIIVTGSTESGKSYSRTFNLRVVATANNSPSIFLNGTNPYILALNSSYVEPGFNAYDAEDGNLNSIVITSNTINKDSVGLYTVSYVVTDNGGLKDSVVRTVKVENNLNYLSGQYTCSTNNITTGGSYNWITSATASVSENNKLKLFKISDCFMADPILTFDPITNLIDIPSQTFFAASATDTTNHTFVGNGNIINTGSTITIALDYQVTYFNSLQGMIVTESRRDTLRR